MNHNQKKLLSNLIQKYYKKYVNIAKGYTHNKEEAEDIVSETYLYICKRSYKDPELREQTYESYFISALVCRCINFTKKRKIIYLDNKKLDALEFKEHIEPMYTNIDDLLIFTTFFCGTKKIAKKLIIETLTPLISNAKFLDLEDKDKLTYIKGKIKNICKTKKE